MSDSAIELQFGDGDYTFAIPLPHIKELERKCGIGIGGLLARVSKGCFTNPEDGQVYTNPAAAEFYALDLIETIRHGLIGGGKGVVNGEEIKVTPQIANKLVDTYVLDHPLKPSWNFAVSILVACVIGFDPPKDEAGVEPATATATEETTDTSITA